MAKIDATKETMLVVGGGISAMTAALEAAVYGKQVILIEQKPSLFPKTMSSNLWHENQLEADARVKENGPTLHD